MIKIVKNPNFPQFLEIFSNADLIEEVQGRAKAVKIAKRLARKQGLKIVIFGDKMLDSSE
jgi:hypothetical protein